MFYFRTLSTKGPSFGEPSPAARVGCFSLLAALLFSGLCSQPCPPMLSWMKGASETPPLWQLSQRAGSEQTSWLFFPGTTGSL